MKLDDFDIGPQSDEFDAPENGFDDTFADDYEEPFDRDLRDDEAALESVYGPEDNECYDDGGW